MSQFNPFGTTFVNSVGHMCPCVVPKRLKYKNLYTIFKKKWKKINCFWFEMNVIYMILKHL